MSVIRRRWHFTGNVQGVEAQGERAALDELVPMIERSNRWARIEGMTTETLPPEEHEYSFSTRG